MSEREREKKKNGLRGRKQDQYRRDVTNKTVHYGSGTETGWGNRQLPYNTIRGARVSYITREKGQLKCINTLLSFVAQKFVHKSRLHKNMQSMYHQT